MTVAQISIWNRGNEAIRADSILDSIRVVVRPPCSILKANVQKMSRSVTGISLSMNRSNEGIVPISWKILEKGDGAVVQIMYAGTADSQVSVEGTIEGQREIFALHFPGQIRSVSEQVAEATPTPWFPLIWVVTIGVLFVNVGLYTWEFRSAYREGGRGRWIIAGAITVIFLVLVVFVGYEGYVYALRPVPPFGH